MSNADIQVILEKINNLHEIVEGLKSSNNSQHKTLIKAQKYTNGKVRKLQVWKGTLGGAIAVVVFIMSFFVKDYIGNRDKMAVLEQKVLSANKKVDVVLNELAKK